MVGRKKDKKVFPNRAREKSQATREQAGKEGLQEREVTKRGEKPPAERWEPW